MSSSHIPAPGTRAPLLPPGKLELAYLFCARLADGTIYEQNAGDTSPFTPGRSAYYELLECGADGCPKQDSRGKLVARSDIDMFQLEDGDHRYLVDLRDGHFEVQHQGVDGAWVGAHLWLGFPPPDARLRLSYFRRRRHHQVAMLTVRDDLTVASSNLGEGQECEYHLGWETEDGQYKAEMILV